MIKQLCKSDKFIKGIISLLFLFSGFSISFGQKDSLTSIYNKNGQLYANSSIIIDSIALEYWKIHDHYILYSIYQKIMNDELITVNGVDFKCLISFTISPDSGLTNLIIEQIDNKKISSHLNYILSEELAYSFFCFEKENCNYIKRKMKFYVPIKHTNKETNELIDNNGNLYIVTPGSFINNDH